MIPRQVRIDQEQYRALEEIAKKEDRSIGYLIRQLIKLFLEGNRRQARRQLLPVGRAFCRLAEVARESGDGNSSLVATCRAAT